MDLFSPIISHIIEKYFDVNQNDKTTKYNKEGKFFEIKNLSFKKDIFLKFGIPLQITKSTIENGQIFLKLIIEKEKSLFKIKNVDIFSQIKWSALKDIKKQSIYDIIQLIQDKNLKDMKINIFNFFDNIIDNASLSIENIRLHIKFLNQNNEQYSIVFFIESLKIDTVDNNGNIIFLKEKPNILIKQVKISNLCISMSPYKSSLDQIDYNAVKNSSFIFTMINNKRKEKSFFDHFNLNFSSLLFTLDKDQYQNIQFLINSFSINRIHQRINDLEKPLLCKGIDYKSLFLYFHRCAIRNNVRNSSNIQFMLQFLKMRRKFVKDYQESLQKTILIDTFMKKYGENLTYSLMFYSSIVIFNEKKNLFKPKIKIFSHKNEIPVLPNDSLQFEINVSDKISLDLKNLFCLSIDKPQLRYCKINDEQDFNLKVTSLFIEDYLSHNIILQRQKKVDDFILLSYNSKSNISTLNIADFKVNVQSSFLHRFSKFFFDSNKIETKLIEQQNIIKLNSLNQYLMVFSPKFMQNFTVKSNVIKVKYIIDEDRLNKHVFKCTINHVKIENFSNVKLKEIYGIESEININQIKIDEFIISKHILLKSLTLVLEENFIKSKLVSTFSIPNSSFKLDSHSIDIINNCISSILTNFKIDYYDYRFTHTVLINCSDIRFGIKLGDDEIILSIEKIEIDPFLQFQNIVIEDETQDIKCNIPCLSFNEWPIIKTDLMEIKSNSNNTFNSLNHYIQFINQIKKIANNFICKQSEKQKNASFFITKIKFNFDNDAYLLLLENTNIQLDDFYHINISRSNLMRDENQKIMICDKEINISSENQLAKINVPIANLNMTTDEIITAIIYLQKLPIENISKNKICLNIDKFLINIDELFNLSIDNTCFKLDNSTFLIKSSKISFDQTIDIIDGNLEIKNNNIVNLYIPSITALISPENMNQYVFFQSITQKINSQQLQNQYNFEGKIENIKVKESLTNLNFLIPKITITFNYTNSAILIQVASITFDKLILKNIGISRITQANKQNNITNIDINSIDLQYTHYFSMVVFNAFKSYQSVFIENNYNFNQLKCDISAKVETLKIEENSLPNSIIFSQLKFDRNVQTIQFKCGSINIFEFIQKRDNNTDILIIEKKR